MAPTIKVGLRSSYTDRSINVRDIADVINVVSPKDTPFLKLVGWNAAQKLIGHEIWDSEVEWIEDQLRPTKQVQTGATEWTNSTDSTQFTAANGNYFRKGQVLKVDDELMWVSAVSGDNVTVTRGVADTTATTHSSTCTVEIVGIAMIEGDEPPPASSIVPSIPKNYTQIFEDTVEVTGTERQILKYGREDPFNYRKAKIFKELPIQLERACFHGRKAAGTASTPRMMGGLDEFVTAQTNLNGEAITQRAFEDAMQSIYDLVGQADMANTIICGAWVKRVINSWYAGNVRTTRDEKRGGIVISQIDTDFGTVDIALNRWCVPSTMYLLNVDYIGVAPLRGRRFQYEPLAKTKDADKGHIFGEYTLIVKNADCHKKIVNISTTKAK